MRINTIKAVGLKSGDFEHKLDAVNVLVGANASGKTARIEAIRLALLGYLPELGKLGSATMGLARNGMMRVEAELSGCPTPSGTGRLMRSWRMERGSVKPSSDGELTIPPVLMDPNEYFALGDKDRVRYVFKLAKMDGVENTPEVICSNLKRIKIEDHDEQHEKAVDGLVDTVKARTARRKDMSQTWQEWIEELVFLFRDNLKLAKQNQDRMSKTVQGLTALKSQDDDVSIANVDQELAKLRAAGQTRAADIRTRTDRIKALGQMKTERENLVKALASAVDSSDKISELEAEQAKLLAATSGHKSDSLKLMQEGSKAKFELEATQAEIARLSNELKALEARFNQDMSADACPHCGASGEGWKDKLKTDFANESDALAKVITDLNAKEVQQTQVRNEARERFIKAGSADREVDGARAKLHQVLQSLNSLRAGQAETEKIRNRLEAMGESTEDQDGMNLSMEADQMIAEQARDTEKIQVLAGRQVAYQQHRQDEARNAQALLANAAVSAEKDVLTKAVTMLEAMQAEMVKAAFGTILVKANRLTTGVLKTPIEYHDGELGRFEGATWISHKTFSGSEKAVTFCGISMALACESPIKIMLLDELARFDRDNLNTLLATVKAMIQAGDMDQFCGCGTEAVLQGLDMDGINVIRI